MGFFFGNEVSFGCEPVFRASLCSDLSAWLWRQLLHLITFARNLQQTLNHTTDCPIFPTVDTRTEVTSGQTEVWTVTCQSCCLPWPNLLGNGQNVCLQAFPCLRKQAEMFYCFPVGFSELQQPISSRVALASVTESGRTGLGIFNRCLGWDLSTSVNCLFRESLYKSYYSCCSACFSNLPQLLFAQCLKLKQPWSVLWIH